MFKNLPQLKQQILKEKKKRKLSSLYEFIKYFWDIAEGRELVDNWHIKYLSDEVEKVFRWSTHPKTQTNDSYDLIINVPPGTSKSTIVSKIGCAYLWTLNPNSRVVSASYSEYPVKEFTDVVRRVLDSDDYQDLYGVKFLTENVRTQTNNFGGKRYTTSTGGSVTGIHADIILYDDPNKPPEVKMNENGEFELELGATLTDILKANAWHDSTLQSRKTDKLHTRTIYVQQRVDDIDLSGYLLEKATKNGGPNIKHINLPSEVDKKSSNPEAWERLYVNGELKKEIDLKKFYKRGVLDSSRMGKKILEKERVKFGSYIYQSQFMQNPNRASKGRIDTGLFEIIDESEVPNNLVRFFYTDPSEGKKTSDNMATLCWSIHERQMIIWEIIAVKKMFNQFVGYKDDSGDYIKKTYDNFIERNNGNWQSLHFFEAKNTGSAYIQYLSSQTDYNIIEDIPKGSKADRLEVVKPRMESGRVKLVKSSKVVPKWINDFLHEASRFTGEAGGKDDMVDTLTGALARSDFSIGSVFQKSKPKMDNMEYTL